MDEVIRFTCSVLLGTLAIGATIFMAGFVVREIRSWFDNG